MLSPESAATELRQRRAKAERTGVLFGPERSGLDNDTIALADAILTAPVSPDFASLSLPQAVLLFGYEWLKGGRPRADARTRHRVRRTGRRGDIPFPTRGRRREASSSHCSSISKPSSTAPAFCIRPRSAPRWCAAIRNMFHRMGATEQDVRTWRGIVAALLGPAPGPAKKGVIVPPRFSYCDCP